MISHGKFPDTSKYLVGKTFGSRAAREITMGSARTGVRVALTESCPPPSVDYPSRRHFTTLVTATICQPRGSIGYRANHDRESAIAYHGEASSAGSNALGACSLHCWHSTRTIMSREENSAEKNKRGCASRKQVRNRGRFGTFGWSRENAPSGSSHAGPNTRKVATLDEAISEANKTSQDREAVR